MEAVSFEVYDTGIGVSLENQESLFKLFGKVMQKNKNINKEGIGLGLYITKNITV
jgi:K+-sensing histidine kinase KdpD